MTKEVKLSSFKNLLEQFESTKKELGDAEENIRKLTGRDPENFPNENNLRGQIGLNKRRPLPLPVPDKPFPGNKRPLFPIVKVKEEGEVKQEESPDEDEVPAKKPSLLSTVVASSKDLKTRKDTIKGQNINSKVKARNRRMFGMILGTLQKFQHDAEKRQAKDLKRAIIEQKVEAAAAEEKERIKKEKEDLFQLRREKQAQLRCLEKKLEIAELHEIWENNEKHLFNFIRTKTEPSICYLPASHNSKTAKCLELSQKLTLERIKERREKTEKELLDVEEMYNKSNFPSDKENIGPIEEEQLTELNETIEDSSNNHISSDTHLERNSNSEDSKLETEMDCEETQIEPTNSSNENHNNSQKVSDNSNVTISSETETKENNHQDTHENVDDDNINKNSNQDFEPIYD